MKQYLPLLSAFEQAAQDALVEHGTAVMARSRQLIPKETGETADSAVIEVNDLTVTGGYTDFVARLQHENLEYEHPRGGEAKFLEKAAEEESANLSPRVQKALRAVLGDG